MSIEKLPVPTTTKKKVSKKKATKKVKLTAEEKEQKEIAKKRIAANKKWEADQKKIALKKEKLGKYANELQAKFEKFCKENKIEAVCLYYSKSLELRGDVISKDLPHHTTVGLVKTSQLSN